MKPEEIRKNIPLWLRVSQWGDVGLTSIKREPFEKPFELEHIGKVGPFQVSAKHQYLFSAVSAVGHFHFIYLEPEDPLDSGGICIMQHGCECLASFSGLFANSINQLLEQGVGVILPVQPYVKPCSDFMVSSTLYMMDRNMMGLRVTLIRGIIDWIEETRPEAKVVLVGHSMGSMVSYFTAAVDERLAGVALDYNDRPTEMIHSPIRTSTVPGLVFLLGKGGMLREEFLQVRSIHRQEYGYPDREALARWVQANTKTVQ